VWATIVLLSLSAFVCSLIWLPFTNGRRKPVGLLAALSFVTMIVAAVIFGDSEAQRRGFSDASDQQAAIKAGVNDPVVWRAARDAERESKVASAAEAREDAKKAAVKKQADDLASKQAEEVRCAADLRCIAEKKTIDASFKCAPLIERLAQNNFEWTDKWYEAKLSHFRWKNRDAKIVTYVGDKIKFQNGFGAWVLSKYECDYNAVSGRVSDVRASPGRLPIDD
jgi:hypothetical protein